MPTAAPLGSAASGPVEPPATPVLDGAEQRLDRDHVVVQRIVGAIVSTMILVPMLVGPAIGLFTSSPPVWVAFGVVGLWLLIAAVVVTFALVWPAVSYRYISYQVTDEMVRIRRGVFWRRVESVPRSRVQHTDVSQGPIERAFDLATLIIYTAGTQHASVSLSGLRHEVAVRIRDHLIAGGEGDAV
jgi:membrane protein YdbS with pleckstrin-like domain